MVLEMMSATLDAESQSHGETLDLGLKTLTYVSGRLSLGYSREYRVQIRQSQ